MWNQFPFVKAVNAIFGLARKLATTVPPQEKDKNQAKSSLNNFKMMLLDRTVTRAVEARQ